MSNHTPSILLNDLVYILAKSLSYNDTLTLVKTPTWVRICTERCRCCLELHDDDIKWKHFPRYLPFVRRIYWLPVNSPHKGQWRGALMFSLICAWTNGWAYTQDAGDLRHHRAQYDVTVMRNKYSRYWRHILKLTHMNYDSSPTQSMGKLCRVSCGFFLAINVL